MFGYFSGGAFIVSLVFLEELLRRTGLSSGLFLLRRLIAGHNSSYVRVFPVCCAKFIITATCLNLAKPRPASYSASYT